MPPLSYPPIFRPCLLLLVQNRLYHTLVDSGSDISFIDRRVVDELDIETKPSNFLITMASVSQKQHSLGTTMPLTLTPVIVNGTCKFLSPLQPHQFEVMDLDQEYSFIIGEDLLPTIFGDSIPMRIACRHSIH